MTDLRLIVYHEHDLPPKWDGKIIVWRVWNSPMRMLSLACRLPIESRACDKCGQVDAPTRSTKTDVRYCDVLLYAFRCECGHDVVYDPLDRTWWDLEAHDYDHEGSTPDGTLW